MDDSFFSFYFPAHFAHPETRSRVFVCGAMCYQVLCFLFLLFYRTVNERVVQKRARVGANL